MRSSTLDSLHTGVSPGSIGCVYTYSGPFKEAQISEQPLWGFPQVILIVPSHVPNSSWCCSCYGIASFIFSVLFQMYVKVLQRFRLHSCTFVDADILVLKCLYFRSSIFRTVFMFLQLFMAYHASHINSILAAREETFPTAQDMLGTIY